MRYYLGFRGDGIRFAFRDWRIVRSAGRSVAVFPRRPPGRVADDLLVQRFLERELT
jgi:hypothetical protein